MSKIEIDITEDKIAKLFRVKGQKEKEERLSIIDIKLSNNYSIHLYEGKKNIGKDFIITYIDKKTKREPRQLSHIHWIVDLLLKMEANKKLTREFIKEIKNNRERCYPAKDNSKESLVKVTNDCTIIADLSRYDDLNKYGMYDVSFLAVILPLIMVQELTNYEDKNPKMMRDLFNKLLEDDDNFDLYSIISKAKYN